ncbi:MAG: hypothetical protein IT378_17965 [Sandaracinaceae bacterium]|nr:hypothetical protein [Sandaracinaceae bacterium]
MRSWLMAGLVPLSLALACTTPRTQIMARLETDMTQGPGGTLTGVVVRVLAMDETTPRFEQRFELGIGTEPITLPAELGLVPADPSANRRVTVEVDALRGEDTLFMRRATVTFAQAHTLRADIFLADRCRLPENQNCPPGTTCGATGCEMEETPLVPADAGVALSVAPIGSSTPTMEHGNTSGGALFVDACAANEVLVGVRGSVHPTAGYLAQIRAICAAISLSGSGPYTFTTAERTEGPIRGLLGGGAPYTASCPPDEVLVGFGGRAGLLVDQLVLRCAPVSIAQTPSGLVPTLGMPADLPPVGGMGGAAFPDTSCPSGSVAVEARIRAGDAIDSFGIGCKRLGVM